MKEEKQKTLTYTQKLTLHVLSSGDKPLCEIGPLTGVSRGCATSVIRSLKHKGLVFINGHLKTKGRRSWLYAVHINHPKPEKTDQLGKNRKISPRLKSMLAAIELHGPMTINEMAEWIGCEKYIIQSAMTYYRENGSTSVFRIASWVYSVGEVSGWKPVYGKGPSKDAEKPKVSKKEYGAMWREKNRAKLRVTNAAYRKKKSGKDGAAANPFWHLLNMPRQTGATT